MTPSRRARELVDDYGQAMLTLGREEVALARDIEKTQKTHGNLCRYIATIEASATAPKGEAVACPQCGAPEGAICKSPFCVRLPPPSPKAEPNPSAVEAERKACIEAVRVMEGEAAAMALRLTREGSDAALEAHRQNTSPPAEAAELAKLKETLEYIASGRGVCRTCGTRAVGAGSGYTACDCSYPVWEPQNPQAVAQAALSGATHDR